MPLALGKVFTVFAWMICACNVAVPLGVAAPYLYGLGIFLIIAHISECLIFTSTLKQHHENIMEGYFLTFVFGYIHILELQKKQPNDES